MAASTPRLRLLVLVLAAALPWTVVAIAGRGMTTVFAFGLVDLNPAVDPTTRVLPLPDLLRYGGGLPRNPELLPASVVLYLAALASAAAGPVGREDTRLTAGLLVLAGVTHLGVAHAFLHRPGYTAVPLGAVVLVALAWWFYWQDLRRTVIGESRTSDPD